MIENAVHGGIDGKVCLVRSLIVLSSVAGDLLVVLLFRDSVFVDLLRHFVGV